jgi:hypothetical protein
VLDGVSGGGADAGGKFGVPGAQLVNGAIAYVLAREDGECKTSAMGVTVLDREMFTEAEAARLLRVSQNTLNYWLEGGEYRARRYRPVIREQARGSRAPVTWAEFVEAGLRRPERCRELVLRGSGRPRLPPLGKSTAPVPRSVPPSPERQRPVPQGVIRLPSGHPPG